MSADTVHPARFRLLTLDEIDDLPEGEWLIENLFELTAFVLLYADPASGKTFMALDWAMSVAAGRAWLGRSVFEGDVIYVATEGARNIKRRLAAWTTDRGDRPVERFRLLPEAVNVSSREEMEQFAASVVAQSLSPRLIVFDTFARCFVGGEENSSKEMGEAVHNLRCLQEQFDCAVLVVHHAGKSGTERGSTALRGAADAVIRLNRTGKIIDLKVEKQKDFEESGTVKLQFVHVELEDGRNSVVLGPAGLSDASPHNSLSSQDRSALAALSQLPAPAKTGDWEKACSGFAGRTFSRLRKRLVDGGYVHSAHRGQNEISDKGSSAIGAPLRAEAA